MGAHDRGLVALDDGDYAKACALLAESLMPQAPISRPVTRLALDLEEFYSISKRLNAILGEYGETLPAVGHARRG